MKSEFELAFNEIAERSRLETKTIITAVELALEQAYRKSVTASDAQEVVARVEPESGQVSIFAEKEVVEDTHDDRTEVALTVAREINPEVQLGDLIKVDSTPTGFGRIAAQTAKQVILQKLKEAERESQYQEYIEREGDIIHGTVQSYSMKGVTLSLGRAEAQMPRNQQMPGERYRTHEKLRVYLLEVRKTARGPEIIVSRTHRNLLRRLLEMEVPEIYNGIVEIKSIAREAGYRSKVAVDAMQQGVDPVGACVGMRGMRIQSIVKELHGEKIDVIQWNPDASVFISKALSPARVSSVHLEGDTSPEGRTATVIVPDDQLSLAIGREGQNARLAAKLTGWRIDIKSLAEAANEAIDRLHNDEYYADLAVSLETDLERVAITLSKMDERKPVMPEEYGTLNSLVNAVEERRLEMYEAELAERRSKLKVIRDGIPLAAYSLSLAEVDILTDRIRNIFLEANFETVGQVLEQLSMDSDVILALSGIGPKIMESIHGKLNELVADLPDPEDLDDEHVLIDETLPQSDVEDTELPELESVTGKEEIKTDDEDVEAESEVDDISFAETIEKSDDEPKDPNYADDVEDIDKLLQPNEKKKKRRKKRSVVFDDERGVFITSHPHKRSKGQFDWEDDMEDME
jgi:N utilization substance protein A